MIKMRISLFVIMLAFAPDEKKAESAEKSAEGCEKGNTEDLILLKIEEDEYAKLPLPKVP
jgi:hypothetical protein